MTLINTSNFRTLLFSEKKPRLPKPKPGMWAICFVFVSQLIETFRSKDIIWGKNVIAAVILRVLARKMS